MADLGQAGSLKATLKSVQGVLITGAIAAGGAIATDEIYDKVGASLGLSGYQRDAAKMATGVALGIIIGKFLGKPRLAAAFAIGPIVAGGLDIFNSLMGRPELPGMQGVSRPLGLVAVEPPLQMPQYAGDYAGDYGRDLGAVQVGPGVPSWMLYQDAGQGAYALG